MLLKHLQNNTPVIPVPQANRDKIAFCLEASKNPVLTAFTFYVQRAKYHLLVFWLIDPHFSYLIKLQDIQNKNASPCYDLHSISPKMTVHLHFWFITCQASHSQELKGFFLFFFFF